MKSRMMKSVLYILISIVLLKLIVALVSLPKPTINYVEKYNEITKPADYDPEQNAAKHYEKAKELFHEIPVAYYRPMDNVEWDQDASVLFNEFDAEVEISEEDSDYVEAYKHLDGRIDMIKWHEGGADLYDNVNPEAIDLIEDWLKTNQPAFDQVKIAVQKPYYWVEKSTDNPSILQMTFIELSEARNISQALLISARLNAIKGNFKQAVDDIVLSYQMGHKPSESHIYTLQSSTGLSIKRQAIETALDIISHFNLHPNLISYFLDSFRPIASFDRISPDLIVEKMILYDTVQGTYLGWIRGFNRPAFRFVKGFRCLCGKCLPSMWHKAFTGPSRTVILKQIDSLFEIYDILRDKTIWEMHHLYINYLDEIDSVKSNIFYFDILDRNYLRIYDEYLKSKVRTEALMTVLAIHKFKQDNDRLPDSLEDLISDGYLKSLPQDPYSEGSLVYRIEGDDFKLYSLGKNFQDNQGEPVVVKYHQFGFPSIGMSKGDPKSETAERMIEREIYMDDVFWPEFQESVIYEPTQTNSYNAH